MKIIFTVLVINNTNCVKFHLFNFTNSSVQHEEGDVKHSFTFTFYLTFRAKNSNISRTAWQFLKSSKVEITILLDFSSSFFLLSFTSPTMTVHRTSGRVKQQKQPPHYKRNSGAYVFLWLWISALDDFLWKSQIYSTKTIITCPKILIN